ncbi:cytochrome c biogenesis protein ResB [Prevotella histicola]|uniref:cytochrome c biogenesis protein ResB n=1 Tax=Prevotella histicola TaxID=470565 RepID=UPI001C5DF492|nr:cytochrome c biogenesis protein ResB [Prevotella histicola]MBW4712042.1 cytochrome c biogenesis protein ResB [Prevotella histicola]MBW4876053.1 cytochrome c biogenesis protein ResB [Prevotella histicola]MBW4920665.1 cytochrome c biogenesis protein ResB [Prevotella histicola]
MWNKPYTLKEGTAIVAGLLVTGGLLQVTLGPLEWGLFAWPANFITLILFVFLLIVAFLLRKRSYFCLFMSTMQAAIPAIAAAAILTLIMGVTKQVAEGKRPMDPVGLTKMLSFWPFILVYVWMTAIVGEVTINQIVRFSWRRFPTLVSHVGLFLILTCGTLGSADMLRVKMYCETGQPEWRGLDAFNNVHQLPVAIQLEKFTIDEYPPKLMLIDKTGRPLPQDKPENLLVDNGMKSGQLLDCKIDILKRIDNAVPVMLSKMIGKMPEGMMGNIRMDSLGQARNKDGYIASDASGSACALLVRVTIGVNANGSSDSNLIKGQKQVMTGWITSGSYLFPYQALRLKDGRMLAMPNREPRRFASLVNIYTQSGQNIQTEIEVNKPFTIEGWKIYQLSYNEQMGKWSNLSVFELVTDPWLPVVYIGIFMLLIGAVGMFLTASRKKEVEP